MRKGQASVEFTIMVIFAVLFLSVTATAFYTQIEFLQDKIVEKQVGLMAEQLAKAVNFAPQRSGNFYNEFDLPSTIDAQPYNFEFEQDADYLFINASSEKRLVVFRQDINFMLGDSYRFCVTSDERGVLLSNQIIKIDKNRLFFGCMRNLTRVSLQFSALGTVTPDIPKYLAPFNVNITQSGNMLNITADGITGSFYLLNVSGTLNQTLDIDDHLKEAVVMP